MYFETGADCLRGMMSPGNIVSGHVVSGADWLWGMLSPGAVCLRGRLSPGWIVSGADCLGAYCLRGTLSLGRIVLGHIVSGRIVSGNHVPPPNLVLKLYSLHLQICLNVGSQLFVFSFSHINHETQNAKILNNIQSDNLTDMGKSRAGCCISLYYLTLALAKTGRLL